MSPLRRTIERLRWFFLANHALSVFSRALLYSLLALCLVAIGYKIALGDTPEWALALGLLIPILLALPGLRRYSAHAVAAELDRTLRLDERLATALQVRGPFSDAQTRDAERELEKSDLSRVRRLHLPKELYFAGACAVVLAATLFAPMPVQSSPISDADPKDQAALTSAELKIRSVNDHGLGHIRELKQEILKQIRRAKENPENKTDVLKTMTHAANEIRRKLLTSSLSRQEAEVWKDLLEALESAGGVVSARVKGKAAERLFQPSPITSDKIAKAAGVAPSSGGSSPTAPGPLNLGGEEIPQGMTVAAYAEKIRQIYQDPHWDQKYLPIVKEFYGDSK